MLSWAQETDHYGGVVGGHSGNSKPGDAVAQKNVDRRAAHLILRGARELLTTRAADLKAQAAQCHQVLGANPGPGAAAGHSPNSTQRMTPVSLPPLPSPLTSPTATPVVLPKEVRNAVRLAWHVPIAVVSYDIMAGMLAAKQILLHTSRPSGFEHVQDPSVNPLL